MSDPKPKPANPKSPWPKRLGVGCGVLVALGLVAMIVANIFIKRYIVERVEEGMAEQGLQANIDELDFSLLRKEIEVRNFTAVPITDKASKKIGNLQLDYGKIKFTTERNDYIRELHLEGLSSKLGSIRKLDVVSGQSILIEGMTLNNPTEFGGGPMMEFGTIKLIYAEDSTKGSVHFTEMRVELTQLTIVRNQQGKWLTDLSPEAERKVRENKKIAAIDNLTFVVGKIRFLDLASGSPAQVVEVNKEIVVNEPKTPRAYPMIVFPKLLWIARQAKKQFGID